MSGLLKSGSAAQPPVRAAEPPRPDPELARLREALAEAEQKLTEQDRLLGEIPAAIEGALAEGEEKGRAQAAEREAERLAIIGKAAEQALAGYAEGMAELERLAALLARTCLDRMLLADAGRTETVAALLRGQLTRLETETAVRIQVSAEDFPSPEALAALAPAPCEIIASPSLREGDCTIQLQLGTLDIGIGQQWGALRDALEEMAG
jgi:flagellar assembly protein FliH